MKIFHRQSMVFCLLGALFAAPGIVAYVFYLHPNWLGEGTTNKGRLLNPPVLLAHPNPRGMWQLALWSPKGCTKDCIAQLDKLARIRLALGRHLYEVDALLLMDTSLPKSLVGALDGQDIHRLSLSPLERKQMTVLTNEAAFFIINPNNYLILAYATTAKSEDIFYDLKQLLTR